MATTNLLKAPIHSSKVFTYVPEKKIFVVEASSIRGPVAGQIYQDACDYGFWIESSRTGKRILLSFDSYDKCDGEVVGSRYSSDEGYHALVIND